MLTFQWARCAAWSNKCSTLLMSFFCCPHALFDIMLHGESSSAWILAFFCWWYFVKCCSMIFGIALTLMIFWVSPFLDITAFIRKIQFLFHLLLFLPKLITWFCFNVHLSSFFSYLLLLSNVLSKLLRFLPLDLWPSNTLH